MIRVSMVMIARDNRDTIGNALDDALAAGCHELIVVDTGSVDETPQIAFKRGARVVSRKWVDDFAHSKNQAISLARNDWCLILDSDDRISDPAELRRFFEHDLARLPDTCDAMLMDIHVGIGPQAHTVTQVRLVRRSSGLRFQFPIHETINCDGHDVYHLREVRINHHRPFDPSHNERNLRILTKHYEDMAGQSQEFQQHIRHNLAREYLGVNDKANARRVFAEYFAAATPEQSHDYWALLNYALATTQQSQRLLRFQAAAHANPYRAEAWVEAGRVLIAMKRYRQALIVLERARRCTYPGAGIAYTPDYTWRPLLLIAVCADALGNYAAAQEFTRAAKAKGAPAQLLAESVAS